MATEPNDVRRRILRRPREELEAEVALANNLLDVLTRYLDQMWSKTDDEGTAYEIVKVSDKGEKGPVFMEDMSKEEQVAAALKFSLLYI
nr:hypothetical protein [Tanacetum cinerariifolium]